MRKILIPFLIILCSGHLALSQTAEESEKLREEIGWENIAKYAAEAKKQESIRKKRFEELKLKSNASETIKDSKGQIGYLYDFDAQGKPMYVYALGTVMTDMSKAPILHNSYLPNLNIQGQGLISGDWEANDNSGVCYPLLTHQEFASNRVSNAYSILGLEPTPSPYSIASAHSTFVDGTLNGLGIVEKGVAPKSSIINFSYASFYTELSNWINGTCLPFPLASTHPYTTSPGGYNPNPFDISGYSYPKHTIVVSLGNSWMSPYASSRNIITVGQTDYTALTNPSTAIPVTSFGPNNDQIRPDLVSLSKDVLGPTSTHNSGYTISTGSSYSAPTVSGGVLLLQELYDAFKNDFMRSSTVRALMVNTVRDIGPPGPDDAFGYGYLDLEKAAYVIKNNGYDTKIIEDQITTTLNKEYTIIPKVNGDPITVTLSWIDAYNSNASLVNNLDVKIIEIGSNTVYYPWSVSTSGTTHIYSRTAPNTKSNLEKIELLSPNPNKQYKVVVSVNGALKGPNNVSATSTNFSLVMSGLGVCSNAVNNNLTMIAPISTGANSYYGKTISATNSITNLGTDINYYGVQEVVLKAGFTASNQAKFLGQIKSCETNILNNISYNYTPKNRSVISFPICATGAKPAGESDMVSAKEENVLIFPNPTENIFKLQNNNSNSCKYQIQNMNGQILFDGEVEANSTVDVDISEYAAGVYYVVIDNMNEVVTKKVIKK